MAQSTATTTRPGEPQAPIHLPPINITPDGLVMLGFVGWFLWDRLIRERVVTKLDSVFQPIEEERRLNSLLAQIGVITNASRVVLAAYHNGSIDSKLGYHLTKLSTINQYIAPGHSPMATPIRDLPVGRIMFELESMMEAGDAWHIIEYSEDLPDACRDHLNRNGIHRMLNRHVTINRLPIGILSLQYDATERRRAPVRDEPHSRLLEELYSQVAQIMRRRIIHPGPIRKAWMYAKHFIVPKATP